MGFGISSNILRPTVSVLDTGSGQNLVRISFLPIKWRYHIHPLHNLSFRSASNNPVISIQKLNDFDHLHNIHARVHFGVVDNLALLLLIGLSVIDKFVREILPMERCIVHILSLPIPIISEYATCRTSLLYCITTRTQKSLLATGRNRAEVHCSIGWHIVSSNCQTKKRPYTIEPAMPD